VKYDDASWHFAGAISEGSPREYGGVHIALLLNWCFLKGWASQMHLEKNPTDVQKVITGEVSATQFLFDVCGGAFTDKDISETGSNFVEIYYGGCQRYLLDYIDVFRDCVYVCPEGFHDFRRFSSMVEGRYELYASTKATGDFSKFCSTEANPPKIRDLSKRKRDVELLRARLRNPEYANSAVDSSWPFRVGQALRRVFG